MGTLGLNIDLRNFTNDPIFGSLVREFDLLISAKSDMAAKDALSRIVRITQQVLGKDVVLTVVENPLFFYGFRVFPSRMLTSRLVDLCVNQNIVDQETKKSMFSQEWMKYPKWYVEMDAKLIRDIGNMLNGKDIAILYLYSLLRVIYNPRIGSLVWYHILVNLAKFGTRNQLIATSPSVRPLLSIPFYTAISKPCYIFNMEDMRTMFGNGPTMLVYAEAVKKILDRYGMMEAISLKERDYSKDIQGVMDWILEAIMDLKYSANRMIHNIDKFRMSCESPYLRLVFRDILIHFNKVQGKYLGIQNALESTQLNPDQQKLLTRMTEEYWKKQIPVIESTEHFDSIDKHGFVKKVNQRDIDLIRIELDDCDSTTDKIYLMERLYRYIGNIEAGLSMLEDPKTASKVRQSKNELLRLKDIAEETRQAIIKRKITPEHYGLYIKYPAGYEG